MARDRDDNAPRAAGFGIGEWYGATYRKLTVEEQKSRKQNRNPDTGERFDCPFVKSFEPAAPRTGGRANFSCKKRGGVCSLRRFYTTQEETGCAGDGGPVSTLEQTVTGYGGLVCTCPMRFVQDGKVFGKIAEVVLDIDLRQGMSSFRYVKEVRFLQRVTNCNPYPENAVGSGADPGVLREAEQPADEDEDDEEIATVGKRENVGRIDTILVDADDQTNWCAVELQAVYFSGKSMASDFAKIGDQADPSAGSNSPPKILPPAGQRHPDFRSSGPKRLLPQLQIKVPTLRRWGKKMAVVIDVAFYNSLAPMDRVGHISNGDIVWCVVTYDESKPGHQADIQICDIFTTTLESAIVGLTAGTPISKPSFEEGIRGKLAEQGGASKRQARKAKQ